MKLFNILIILLLPILNISKIKNNINLFIEISIYKII